ncbi:hypothetical protein like AT4G02320 [Hibiscus trionum]|uniref:Pectinesterase inhibitor domain-containing protein n=1 Tax=Hibiscus trionum TaxID=183268 RepID=A0A9W7IN94_HIBTR|nr:hypothetical protein like AT4G02320 [Hibiscus trionum]
MYHISGRSKILFVVASISALVLLLLSLVALLEKSPGNPQIHHLHVNDHLRNVYSACDGTLYPDLCIAVISVVPNFASRPLPELISTILNRTMYEVTICSANCANIEKRLKRNNTLEYAAINDCLELLNHTLTELTVARADLSSGKSGNHLKLRTFLSAAMTNQYTCLDGLDASKGNTKNIIEKSVHNISHHISNSLAMLNKVPGVNESKSKAFPKYGRREKGFPEWLSGKDRKLLLAQNDEIKFDLIVAKDGSGNFTKINDAVAAAPNYNSTRFVIYIKSGTYFENVEVGKEKKMVMFVGDGMGKTVVKANRNAVDGYTTFGTATVAVVGGGFIAKGMTFENSAGPSKNQAVALRTGSDLSAFYKCSIVAYQDTLYIHSLRQFFRECDIYGTIDTIFGNAAAVFQDCNLYARKPNPSQQNVFTAQGRDDPNQNTGISILNCKLRADSELVPVLSSVKTYLGRPWKLYSRTVVMRSYIDDLVDPAGWVEWSGDIGLSTLYYGEYLNRGPGSGTSKRVTWPGYRVIKSSAEATQFTVGPFIQGKEWLNSTNIPFYLGFS